MSSPCPAYLRAELVKPSNLDAAEMPRLHGFNEEFSPNGVAQVGDRETPALIAVGLSVCIIGGLALASSTVNGGLRLTLGSAPTASRNTERDGSHELVDSLLLQVKALKGEIQQLREAQQHPTAQAITDIEANQKFRNSVSSVYWYSDPAALSIGIESQPDPLGAVPLPRRPAKARPALR
jgi:hypothetical protein